MFIRKLEKLTQFGEDIVNAEVYLRLDKDQERENKISEIKLELPGGPLFAKKQSKSFEESTDEAIDALKSRLPSIRRRKEGLINSFIKIF